MRGHKVWGLSPAAGLDGPTMPSREDGTHGHKAKPLALGLAGGFAILDAYVTPRPLLVAPKPDLNVVGLSRNRKADTYLMQTIRRQHNRSLGSGLLHWQNMTGLRPFRGIYRK
jgi:hypothetical protein